MQGRELPKILSEPTKKLSASVGATNQKSLIAEIVKASTPRRCLDIVAFSEFIPEEYTARGRTPIGLTSLPDGARRYPQAIKEQTSTNMTAADILTLGISEVAQNNGLLTDLARNPGG